MFKSNLVIRTERIERNQLYGSNLVIRTERINKYHEIFTNNVPVLKKSNVSKKNNNIIQQINKVDISAQQNKNIIREINKVDISAQQNKNIIREINKVDIVDISIQQKTAMTNIKNINFSCYVCFDDFDKKQIVDCGDNHHICQKCFDRYIFTKLCDYDLNFPCVCNAFFCKKTYSDDLIKNNITYNTLELYKTTKIKCEEKTIECKICNTYCIKNDKYNHYCKVCKLDWCQVCEKNFCICKINISIENFQIIVLGIISNIFTKRCPQCNFLSFKEYGCHRVECINCKYVWCYNKEISYPLCDDVCDDFYEQDKKITKVKKIVNDIFSNKNIFINDKVIEFLVRNKNIIPSFLLKIKTNKTMKYTTVSIKTSKNRVLRLI